MNAEVMRRRVWLAKLLHKPGLRKADKRFIWNLAEQLLKDPGLVLTDAQRGWLNAVARKAGENRDEF